MLILDGSAGICADLGRVLSTGICADLGRVLSTVACAAPGCVCVSARACAVPGCVWFDPDYVLSAGAYAAPGCVWSTRACVLLLDKLYLQELVLLLIVFVCTSPCCSWLCLVYKSLCFFWTLSAGACAALDVFCLQDTVLHLNVFCLQEPVLLLDVFCLQRPVLLLNVFCLQEYLSKIQIFLRVHIKQKFKMYKILFALTFFLTP